MEEMEEQGGAQLVESSQDSSKSFFFKKKSFISYSLKTSRIYLFKLHMFWGARFSTQEIMEILKSDPVFRYFTNDLNI